MNLRHLSFICCGVILMGSTWPYFHGYGHFRTNWPEWVVASVVYCQTLRRIWPELSRVLFYLRIKMTYLFHQRSQSQEERWRWWTLQLNCSINCLLSGHIISRRITSIIVQNVLKLLASFKTPDFIVSCIPNIICTKWKRKWLLTLSFPHSHFTHSHY